MALFVPPYAKYRTPPDSVTVQFVDDRLPALPVVFWFSVGKVQLVNVPDEGVPRAPPFTTGAPAVPTFTAKAVATPVPRPAMPVDTGNPEQLVNVPEAGVPSVGVVSVGDVRWVFCWATFVPSDHTVMVLPAGIATVVPPDRTMPFLAVEFEIVAV